MGNGVPMLQKDLVFFDTETSSIDPDRGEILELAAIRVSPDTGTERGGVERRIRMDRPDWASAEALQVNGYSAAAWHDAVPLRLALVEMASLLGLDDETIVVGHNVDFDLDFLKASATRAAVMLAKPRRIDTMSMAWPMLSRGIITSLSLDALCKLYGISNVGAHRAMTDVRRTLQLYRKLMGIAK